MATNLKSRIGPRHFSNSSLRSGSALVVVLAFLLLFVGLVLFFLSRVLLTRQVADSSFNETKAQILAQNGLDVIVGDLKQEITAGSTKIQLTFSSPATNYVYEPKNVAGTTVGTNMTVVVNAPATLKNLIRSSLRTDSTSMTKLAISSRASYVNSTTDVSANGRYINLSRWNSHFLLPLKTPGSEDSTPAAAFSAYAPDWIIVTRKGPQVYTAWNATLKDSTTSNINFATGRYAFAIYDEGGLIDANVAGFPSALAASQAGKKGSLAFADLTQLPNPTTTTPLSGTQIDQLVGWRNYATTQPSGNFTGGYTFNAASTTSYVSYVAPAGSSPPTFLTTHTVLSGTGQTDQAFNSRQDLIRYQRATGLSPDVLQYLGTFTRELNRPSYYPRATKDATFTTTPSVTYPNSFVPIIEQLGVKTTGQPYLTQRFPLSRLALFANPTANAAAIQTYFGLTQVDAHTWTYNNLTSNNSSGRIHALSEAANPTTGSSRSPDFFELLQASILDGSFFYASRISPTYNWAASPPNPDPTIILQLGANIINQYQTSNFPITIQVPTTTPPQLVTGIDDLPYFSEMLLFPYRPVTGDPYRSELDGYLSFEFWNPHQNTSSVTGPTQVRLVMTPPTSGTSIYVTGQDASFNPKGTFSSPSALQASASNPTPTYQVVFNNLSTFRDPTILSPANVVATGTSAEWTTVTPTMAGFLCGQITGIPDLNYANSQGLPSTGFYSYINAACTANYLVGFELQYWDATAAAWFPYQAEPQVGQTTSLTAVLNEGELSDTSTYSTVPAEAGSNSYTSTTYYANKSFQLVDPRYPHLISGQATPNGSVRPIAGTGMQASRYEPQGPHQYAVPDETTTGLWPTGYYPASYNENLSSSSCYLTDADGVTRPADGYLGSAPYTSGQSSARPIILHRPFRSIAEMGYTCRSPGWWKTINFFSPTSADAGLLDYFSLEDAPVVAGKINLNTRQPVTLQAALSGAYREESSGTYLPSANAATLAAAICAHTATAPLMSKADIVRTLLSDSTITSAIDTLEGTTNKTIKGRREAMVRALADVGTTRSWNLLIDIIAQSGRYAPNASTLSQFTVQGEKHYWLHIAIDRYTGQIIDQQLEDVDE